MIAWRIAVSTRALSRTFGAAGAALLCIATADGAGAQSVSFDDLMKKLEGKPTRSAAPPIKGRSRSFTAKEFDDPTPEPAAAAPAQQEAQAAPIQHPEVDLEIYFTPASSRITKQAEPDLNVIGKVLSHEKFRGAKFRIAGHTDGIGGAAYNLDLSRRRAQAVRTYLMQRFKIPAAQIEAVGFGLTQLKVPEDISSPRNRRVQIVNLSAAK
jgi:outer membrane protein OmpA-like peptidoglycan-associated protein